MATTAGPAHVVVPRQAGPLPALSRPLSLLLGAAAVVLLGIGFRAGSEIVAPVLLGLVLTIAVLPLTHWARGHGWPTSMGALLALVASCGMVLVLLLGISLPLAKLVELVPQYAGRRERPASRSPGPPHELRRRCRPGGHRRGPARPCQAHLGAHGVLQGALGLLGDLFMLVTLLFFFCTALPLAGARAATLQAAKPDLAASLQRFVRTTQRYLVVTALFGAIVAVFDTGALWLLGVPVPLVWGLFSFVTNFIPNIGFVLGVIPPALLALLSDGWAKAVLVIVVYSTLNVVIQTFIQPRFVASSVGLSAEVTFLSLVVWTFLLGAPGALLAVPMTLLVRALLLDADPRAAWVAPLISTDPTDDAAADGAAPDGAASDDAGPDAEPSADPVSVQAGSTT